MQLFSNIIRWFRPWVSSFGTGTVVGMNIPIWQVLTTRLPKLEPLWSQWERCCLHGLEWLLICYMTLAKSLNLSFLICILGIMGLAECHEFIRGNYLSTLLWFNGISTSKLLPWGLKQLDWDIHSLTPTVRAEHYLFFLMVSAPKNTCVNLIAEEHTI